MQGICTLYLWILRMKHINFRNNLDGVIFEINLSTSRIATTGNGYLKTTTLHNTLHVPLVHLVEEIVLNR